MRGGILTACVVAFACGCEAETRAIGALGTHAQSVSSDNRLTLNRLTLNRLTLNRLTLNRLTLNRLSGNRLTLNSADGIEHSPEGRELLEYIAKCALHPADLLVAKSGGVTYEYPGLLALAPEWEWSAPTLAKQHLISACLVAHVNAYGVSVSVSVRSFPLLDADAAERLDYPVYEGAFFGQVLDGDDTGPLKAYSCQGDRRDLALAHSADRADRSCTDDSPDCAVVAMGRCRDVCETRTADYGWRDCLGADGVRYADTVSAYLFADDPNGANNQCADTSCEVDADNGDAAILDCSDANYCEAECEGGAGCTVRMGGINNATVSVNNGAIAEIDCAEANDCSATCGGGADCQLDCQLANSCAATCTGGSDCVVDCRGSNSCDAVSCTGGAGCLLRCNDANSCSFSACWDATVQSCGDELFACGRPCP